MSPRLFDVFNGDADGLCALHQLRLAEPADSELVTGPKRDISLLKRVNAAAGWYMATIRRPRMVIAWPWISLILALGTKWAIE